MTGSRNEATTTLPRALVCMRSGLAPRLFGDLSRRQLQAAFNIDLDADPVRDFAAVEDAVLGSVQLLLTGWGSPLIDAEVLDRAPALKGIVHTAGSVKSHIVAECWDRGVQVSSAADANAVPVAEYVTAMVLLATKQVFQSQVLYRERRQWLDPLTELSSAGAYGRPVGIVGASRIGRRVIDLLSHHDLDLRLFDPTVSVAQAEQLGATKVELPELLSGCDVVSLHAPLLRSTQHMLDAAALALMPDGATLVNTARGGLVDPQALERELVSGRLWGIIDVTDPQEPLAPSSPLYDLPNVVLTPHVAGAAGNELRRLGAYAAEDAVRLTKGLPMAGLVTRQSLDTMA